MRPAHLSIKRTAPNEWSVFVVVADGHWRVCSESTAGRAPHAGGEVVMQGESRVIEKDGMTVYQISYGDGVWHDLAILKGKREPRFYYGKPWHEHVADIRRLIR